ncbi:MAG: efflux RND transporter periplasmic adaptor subunit [Candidatus Caldatribacterium sp.]|uniref:efflux RND transporter periplasmic adaptor subunit n=1 Tax=Candidatus Caldatribacterium sp. TaxID=2282143 RepID=UPI002995468C|nr:efflux RND transporter periplasmic adaptor subunit [Candidatus Caldatribacterium sp.]MCX7730622.1 efflux RND transporter periplasmic adaptor subunit [Candidatus Caldatribacterium sp.]MDW8081592.1 efflux RND transporter periplasmic adaptor subunit [Candidatus Calescibacterium sp.]
MKKWILIGLGGLFVALLLMRSQMPRRVEYFVTEPKDIVETIVAAGRVTFAETLNLSFQVPGILQGILVKEGAKVNKRQTLALLEDTEERNALARAEVALELASLTLRRIQEYEAVLAQEEARRATLEEETAWKEFVRAQRLFSRGSIPQEELESAQKEWERAQSLLRTALLKRESLAPSGVQFLEAQAQEKRARLELAQAENNLTRKRLSAPKEGVVLSVSKEPGEFVQAGETVITLGVNPLQVLTRIDEREYQRVTLGMKAFVRELVSSSGRTFPAEVVRIAPAIDSTQGTFEVTLALREAAEHLKPEAAVNVELILGERQGVLAFPKTYLEDENGEARVWLWRDGRAQPQPLPSFTFFADWVVTDALPQGTILLNPQGLRKGQRVILFKRREWQ